MYETIYKIQFETTSMDVRPETLVHEGCNYDNAIKAFEQKSNELISQGWECYYDGSNSGKVDGYDWSRCALFQKGDEYYTLRMDNFDAMTDHLVNTPGMVRRFTNTETILITQEEANKLLAA